MNKEDFEHWLYELDEQELVTAREQIVNMWDKAHQEGYQEGVEATKGVFRKMVDFNKEIKSHLKRLKP